MERIAELEKNGVHISITAGDGYKEYVAVEATGKIKDLNEFAGYHIPDDIYELYGDKNGLIVWNFRYNDVYERFECSVSFYVWNEKSYEWKEAGDSELWVNDEVIWPLSLLLMELL